MGILQLKQVNQEQKLPQVRHCKNLPEALKVS